MVRRPDERPSQVPGPRARGGGPRDDGGRAPSGAHRAATPSHGPRATIGGGTMAEVVSFHHVQGSTEGVRTLAETSRGAGNVVHTPDLFEGRTFATLDEGMAHVQELGFGTVSERARGAVDGYDLGVVYAGVSLGVLPAQMLAQTQPGAKGAVSLEACVPVSEFGDAWPDAVPVQVHGMDADPSFAGEGDLDAARELVESTPDAESFVYPGDRHLFTDPSSPSYEPEAAALVTERVIRFLDGIR
ncbi:hypothetical protein OY671_001643 [Metschnikowia pulcherrima]|nr:hypothetical protein OY671_001643 [Metschnikowia pulcherrima]